MLAFSSLGLACLALLSVVRAAPTEGTPTGELAKRFAPSAANTCYYVSLSMQDIPRAKEMTDTSVTQNCPAVMNEQANAAPEIRGQTYCRSDLPNACLLLKPRPDRASLILTSCSYSTVICRYTITTGQLVSGYYIENDNAYRDCPTKAQSNGPCDQTGGVAGAPANVAARSFAKPLTPLEQKLKARQWSSKKAVARAEKKGSVAWLKSVSPAFLSRCHPCHPRLTRVFPFVTLLRVKGHLLRTPRTRRTRLLPCMWSCSHHHRIPSTQRAQVLSVFPSLPT
jgi:hypothetical protein